MRKVTESFYATIWGEPELGKFRVRLYPPKYGDSRTYVADMDTATFSKFIASFGADLEEISKEISLKQALTVEDVDIAEGADLEEFGFELSKAS
jgi:hypothetical protein